MNSIIISGNLGKDPELKQINSDLKVCSFSVAVSKKVKGEDVTTWFNVQTWNKLAEISEKYLKKGSKVLVQGELQIEEYEKDGVKKQAVKINATTMEMLSSKDEAATSAPKAQVKQEQPIDPLSEVVAVSDSELPF